MAIKITYADGKSEIVKEAVKVDYNSHENTYDFCDDKGQPLRQLVLATGVTWTQLDESASTEPEKNK
jgi:hypothetical protein